MKSHLEAKRRNRRRTCQRRLHWHTRDTLTLMSKIHLRHLPAATSGALQRQASDTVILEGYLEKKGGSKGGFRNWYVTGDSNGSHRSQ